MDEVRRPRLLIVSADMGAGHHEVTAELTRRCSAAGAQCETVDVIADAGPPGARLKRTYRLLLARAPWLYDTAMRVWARWPGPLEWFTSLNAGPFERLLADAVERTGPDAVVSTYNLASQCLGRLVRRGRLRVPVVTFLPDPGAHPYWVSRDVAFHLVPTELTAARLAAYGAPGVRVVRPVLRREFAAPPERDDARAALGLPVERRIAVLTAGSWAVGGLPRTLAAVRQVPDVLPVVLCGRDEALRASLAADPDVVAVGWTSSVVDYLAAADVVVDNAGGLTCWEALASGTPVVMYRPLAGHGRVNVATLAELAWVRWASDERALARFVSSDDDLAPVPRLAGADAAELILAAARQAA
jgi:UDP-N-acetylglucosamine:LPS N-acetylglucosamine transferase